MLFILRMLLMSLLFVVAGLLGLILGLCRPFNPDNSRLCALMYSAPALLILRLKMNAEVKGLLEHQRSCVIIANHQSNYDLFVVGRVVPPRTVCIGKQSLKWVPFFGQLFWLAGNVMINRGDAAHAKQAMLTTTDTLQHKDTSIWMFAEGTRNLGKGLLPFKKGAFQMAIAAGVPIIPVCVSSYARDMRLNSWNAGDVMIRSLAEIPTAGLTLDDMPQLIETCHAQMKACIEQMDQQLAAA
ncbi:1-acyl-sn-glycerol-3-phosphate acyltransferase [Pseudomonas pohangensis]|uniref:1-acyl-sn-glycerol-3-phosphate acyltransferase n=1 Tax=Pseudomonas pohangensis TaxID=364197 RepID=A0A1H2FT15_9PSED|nr:1-acylglycerol-3-phosphate O-acyltransferase [Pseudomonas pohangensis]SDU10479.1 1-acyl-sn-glycerol-3-phosphate acyltransferase [Pseudomonas pohangensis]